MWAGTTQYTSRGGVSQDTEGDIKAIKEMARITRRDGRMVITVPYGRLHNYGWFQQYDRRHLDRLISASGCRVLRKDLYIYTDGWHRASEGDLTSVLYKDNGAPAAAAPVGILLGAIAIYIVSFYPRSGRLNQASWFALEDGKSECRRR